MTTRLFGERVQRVEDQRFLRGQGRYVDDDVAELCRGFRVVHDGPFRFDDGEIVEARWVTFAELEMMRCSEHFLPDSIAMLLPLLTG